MKIVYSFLGLMTLPLLAAAPTVDPLLQDKILAKSSEVVTVIAQVKNTGASIMPQGTRALRQQFLMDQARTSQTQLNQFLQEPVAQGEVSASGLWISNIMILRGPAQWFANLTSREDLVHLELDSQLSLPKMPEVKVADGDTESLTYGLKKVRAPEVWEKLGVTGKGVRVGVLDTGIFKAHPDFADRVAVTKDFISDYADNESNDGQGHGTHCAGTIGGGNTSGRAIGVAPGVSFVIGKIFNDSGSTTMSAILQAMQWIADPDSDPETADQPRVVSNSWGGGQGSLASEKPRWEAVQNWRNLGIVPVFAAGNSGPWGGSMSVPGAYPHSFAVGATDGADAVASFSSRGPVNWGGNVGTLIKPDISAPGVDVYSAKHTGGYTVMSGTSMATPHIAGIVALMLEASPDLTVDRVEAILMETSVDLGASGKDNDYGQGRVDAYRAVELALKGGTLDLGVEFSGNTAALHMSVMPGNLKYTSMDGKFRLGLAEGNYTAVLSAFGYISQSVSFTVKAKEVTQALVKMQSAPSHQAGFQIKNSLGEFLAGRISFENTPLEALTIPQGGASIVLPAGTYTVKAQARGYRTRQLQVEVAQEEQFLVQVENLPALLLVDDEDKKEETYFVKALQAMGQDFDLLSGTVSLDDALGYPSILWFTGRASTGIFTPEEIETLTKYVENGGHLILSGQDIGYSLKSNSFLRDVVGAKYVKDTASVKTVVGLGLNLILDGEDSASNQKYPDVIEALDGASLLLSYSDFEGAATRHQYNQGIVTYLGFGVEGVSGAENRQNLLASILKTSKEDTTKGYIARLVFSHTRPDGVWQLVRSQLDHTQLDLDLAASIVAKHTNLESLRPVLIKLQNR